MGNIFEAFEKHSIYTKKEGTRGSYYHTSGLSVLPRRLSISKESEYTRVAKTGRNSIHKIAGQVLGKFTQKEQSPLKKFKPFECRTQIWQIEKYPSLIGYGTVGISNYYGKVDRNSDNGDLIILYSPDRHWDEIHIYYFAGMIMQLYGVMEYVYNKIK